MADATLIQGARELAAAKSGAAPGAAFSAGVQKSLDAAAVNAAAQSKANMAIFDTIDGYQKEFSVGSVTTFEGNRKNMSEGDIQNVTRVSESIKSEVSNGAVQLGRAKSEGDYKGMQAARDVGASAKAQIVQLKDQTTMLGNFRNAFTDLNLLTEKGDYTEIAKLPGNVKRMKQMETLLSSNWSMKNGFLTFANGDKLVDMELPFTTNIGKEFMEYAGEETKAMSKYTQSQVPGLSNVTKIVQENIKEYWEGEEGLDRLELLTSENYFKELPLGQSINFDRNDPESIPAAKQAATDLVFSTIMSAVKPDKVTEGKDGEDTKGVNNPNYAAMQKLQEDFLATPPLNRAARYGKDDLVFTLGSKNTEAVLKKDGWYIQSKQPDGTVYFTKYNNVEDLLERNSNLFN